MAKYSKQFEEGLKQQWRELKRNKKLPKDYRGRPITQKDFIADTKRDIEKTKQLNANEKRRLTNLQKTTKDVDILKLIKERKESLTNINKALTGIQKTGYTPNITGGTIERLQKESRKSREQDYKKIKDKKRTISEKEKINRLGISENKSVYINGKEYTMSDIAKSFENDGVDLYKYFLGDTQEFVYNPTLQRTKTKKYSNLIDELSEKHADKSNELQAMHKLMFGDIVDDTQISKVKKLFS